MNNAAIINTFTDDNGNITNIKTALSNHDNHFKQNFEIGQTIHSLLILHLSGSITLLKSIPTVTQYL